MISGNETPGESPAVLGKKAEEKWIAKSKRYGLGSLTGVTKSLVGG